MFQPFNPLVGMITLVREVRKWWAQIDNEDDILDMVLESPSDFERITFKWAGVHLDMGHDGVTGPMTGDALNTHMETLSGIVPCVTKLGLTLFPR